MSKKKIIKLICVGIICMTLFGIWYSGIWVDWVAEKWTNEYRFSISLGTTDNLYNVTLYLPILMIEGEPSPLMFEINYPSDWVWNITETEYGKMLKISVAHIPPYGCEIAVSKKTDHIINTKNPVGNEPILYPRFNISDDEYSSYIYGEYNTSSVNRLNLRIWMSGSKNRAVLTAIEGGKYKDRIEYSIVGESPGWHKVSGTLETIGK